ncbi:MAG TPA: acetate kinase, partial [Candidatus Polarisedimenticolaceae bacterium]|nr:acetate kinase [Candidatus Polarisedimenticolaceae bacterium]
MRELLDEEAENGDRRARLAIEVFFRRVRRYIGAYMAESGGTDALIFTGGIGENAPVVREKICRGLEFLGLRLDPGRNATVQGGAIGAITAEGARLPAYVIPTDEELLIARDTVRVVENVPRPW